MPTGVYKRIKDKSKTTIMNCLECGKQKEVYKSSLKSKSFCSPLCFNGWRSKNIKGNKHWNWQGG